MTPAFSQFSQVWLVDFEFTAPPGERPDPVCMVATEVTSGQTVRLWQDDLRRLHHAPFATDESAVMVAYYASAEIGCFLSLGWPLPRNILDLYAEFRNGTNGWKLPCGNRLPGALIHYGIDTMDIAHKESMQQLALRGGPYTQDERQALLAYCESDVQALAKLLAVMQDRIDWPRALLRGRFMAAAARIEHNGVPIDASLLSTLRGRWKTIQAELIRRVDASYRVYDGRTFKAARWAAWLEQQRISWPRLESGALDLQDDTFREMSRIHPAVAPMRELRASLSLMRLEDLAVGSDSRNRYLISAYQARTGRNQPSSKQCIFGTAVWLRGLIQPPPGQAVAYIDWGQQEVGIAAALSKDPAMMEAYTSGDCYMTFAVQAGAAPAGATKATHRAVRELFKACVLAVQYQMGAASLAQRIGRSVAEAQELLDLHRRTYRRFWQWSDAAVDYAMLHSRIHTVFGWTLHVTRDTNARSLRNFPMQANGSEMLRLACILSTEAGIAVCAPVHDALLIEAPVDRIDQVVLDTQELMATASRAVLGGFKLRSDVKIIRHPDRYMDERGVRMWETVMDVLGNPPTHERAAHSPVRHYPHTGEHPFHLMSGGVSL